MPRDLDETIGKEVYYPDEIHELGTMRLISNSVYEAEEVDSDDAKFGLWLEVETGQGNKWISAPSDLREKLVASDFDTFQVRSVEKGPQQHDPYEFEIAFDPEQH